MLAWSSAAAGQTVPISGRVTSTAGAPLSGARVEARDADAGEGAAATTTTNAAGRYLLRVRPGREYALSAEAAGFVGGTVLVKATAAGAIRDLRLPPAMGTPTLLEGLTVRAPRRTPQPERRGEAPGAALASRGASISTRYPGDPGDLAASVGTSGQVIRGAGGLSIAGQGPSANRTTVDGAGFDAGSLPPEALAAAGVVAHPYDVSRGQFTGGELAARTMSGTNLWGGAFRGAFQDGARESMAAGVRTGRLGGGGGGPIVPGRLFVYGAGQWARQESPARSLDPDDPRLQSLGVSADSARRLLQILDGLGVRNAAATDAQTTTGAMLARLDYLPGSRHSLTLRLDARGRVSEGAFASPFSASGGGESSERSRGALLNVLTRFRGGGIHDASVYVSRTDQRSAPGAALPAGELWLRSDLDDGSRGISTLSFAGDALSWPAEDRAALELSDRLSVPVGRAHRLQVGGLYLRESVEASAVHDRYGTFTFATLEDVEAGRPVRFTRWLGSGVGKAVTATHALYAGDLWTPRRSLRVTYGVRAERTVYDLPDAADPGDSSLMAAPGTSPWSLSPRAGFTWSRNTPRTEWVLRGGAGRFRAAAPTRSLAALWVEPGLGYGVRLECVGTAVPAPRWESYRTDPSSVPTRCAGGDETRVSDPAGATGFTRGFDVPGLWRASFESFWLHKESDTSIEVAASASRGRGLPLGVDRNLAEIPAFTLPEEAGRPVYAAAGAIDPATGRALLGASRRREEAGVVRSLAASGRSASEQLSVSATRSIGKGLLRAHYTLTRARDHASALPGLAAGFPTTGLDPRRASWASADFEQRHAFQLSADYSLSRWASLTLYGSLTSGTPFTPMVDVDLNGDGFANDRAFIFDPAAAGDADLARGLAELMDRAPDGMRSCLRAQIGRVAARNSCRAPWNPRLDVQLNLQPGGAQRGRIHFMIVGENVTAGLDRALHDTESLRGWGQDVSPNPVLLRVTGFDPATRRYAYQVNPAFGSDVMTRRPFAVRLQMRFTLGADPATQSMMSAISTLRSSTSPEEIRREILRQWQNTPSLVLASAAARNVQLDPDQRRVLRSAADSVARGVASFASALVETEVARPSDTHQLLARAQSLLTEGFERAHATLTPEQWSRLPGLIRRPPRAVVPLGTQNSILIAPDL